MIIGVPGWRQATLTWRPLGQAGDEGAHETGLLVRPRLTARASQRRPISAVLGQGDSGCYRADRTPTAYLVTGTPPEVQHRGSAIATSDILRNGLSDRCAFGEKNVGGGTSADGAPFAGMKRDPATVTTPQRFFGICS